MRFVDRLILNRMDESLHIRCPAKVNLFLKVVGKRSDGYHEVQNVMQTVTLFDELKVRKKVSGVRLTCSEPELAGNPEQNLVFKAADLFLSRGYGRGGLRLELRKRTPIAAGLGGGSSDGACCLLALNELFGRSLSPEVLKALAGELGSDAPFFVEGGTALCTGKGEVVRQLRDAPRFAGILAAPDRRLKTAEIYRALDREDFCGPEVDDTLRAIEEGDLKGLCSALFNGLETVAFREAPELRKLKGKLEDVGSVGTVLCGSGPTLLAIFPGAREAEMGLSRLTQETGFAALVSAF